MARPVCTSVPLAPRHSPRAFANSKRMSTQRETPGVRLLVAGVGLLVVLADAVFPFFLNFGPVYGRLIPAGFCVLVLVLLAPLIMRGSWKHRLLAASLTALPAVLLVFFAVGLITMLWQR
jgi:hypothetical protein